MKKTWLVFLRCQQTTGLCPIRRSWHSIRRGRCFGATRAESGFHQAEQQGIDGQLRQVGLLFIIEVFYSFSWLPILPDRPLGSFMDNLGPGQVVGRQALGSSPLGELHVGLSVEQGTGLVVDVREARNLKTSGPKGVPGSRNWVLWR